jgi:hypothetical protein
MTDTTWLTEPWVLWITVYLWLIYEGYALWTQFAHKYWPATTPKPSFLITISRMFWRAKGRFDWLSLIVLAFLSWLIPHLVIGHTVEAWVWTAILVVTSVVVFFVRRKQGRNG